MTHCSARKAASAFAACLLVALVTGCKSSEKIVVDSAQGSNWIRCAMGQSFVAESTDDPPTQFGGATEAWKDYYCVNEDTGSLWWDRLDVMARKYNGTYLCDTSAMVATTVNRSVSISDTATCAPGGSSHIWVMGTHGASRPGGSVHRELSATPEVFSS